MTWMVLFILALLGPAGWVPVQADATSVQVAAAPEQASAPAPAMSAPAATSPAPTGATPAPTGAAPANPAARLDQGDRMQFAWVREGGECRERCRAWISATGRIVETTATEFEAFVQGLDVRGATVVLDSAGGMVDAGLALGRAFRRLGLATTVGRTTRLPADGSGERRATLSPRATCASMCVFALLGGARRHVPDEARVLVHQIWPSRLREDALAATYSAGNMVRIQRELGLIARYTVEMGADIELFELATRIPPWEALRPLNREELRRMRVQTAEQAAPAAAATPETRAVEPVRQATSSAVGVLTEPPSGWAITRQGERAALTRRYPLTVEGQEIGSFEIAFLCGEAPNAYQVAYRETRAAAPGGAADRLAGVRMMLQREPLMLKVDGSAPAAAATELVSSARGRVPPAFAGALAEFGGASLLVETITAGKQRTAIRVGPAGLAEGFRELVAGCHK